MSTPQQSTLAELAGAYRLRRFATEFEDLEADFTAPRPCAITDVLSRCSGSVNTDRLWDLAISSRTRILLAVAGLSGLETFDASFACSTCGEALEVSLSLEELLALGDPPAAVTAGGASYRVPTGRDQWNWLQSSGERGGFLERILRDLKIDGAADAAMAEAALENADPLMRTMVAAACPECGSTTECELDAAEIALRRLQAEQARLLSGVHLLASRYHWSERDIFALPAWRRDLYLDLLRQEN